MLSAGGATDSSYWNVELAARSTDAIGAFEIDHGVTVSTGRIKVDGYAESGADGLALRFEDQAFNYRMASLDASLRGPGWRLSDALVLRPTLDAVYMHQFGDDDYALTSQLIDNTAQAVTIRTRAPAEDRFDAGLGVALSIGERWTLSARYARQLANDLADSHAAALTLSAAF